MIEPRSGDIASRYALAARSYRETKRKVGKGMKKCVKFWAAALVAALVIGFAACTGCVGGGDPVRRAAVKA